MATDAAERQVRIKRKFFIGIPTRAAISVDTEVGEAWQGKGPSVFAGAKVHRTGENMIRSVVLGWYLSAWALRCSGSVDVGNGV